MRPTFNQTVNILVQAYLNDTLQHSWCSACAVGNLVAYANQWQPVLSSNGFRTSTGMRCAAWDNVFITAGNTQSIHPEGYAGLAKKEIDSTGYTWQELAKIEFAFESAPKSCCSSDTNNEEWMFNGLMAVVDVLADIHGISLEQKEQAKLLFA